MTTRVGVNLLWLVPGVVGGSEDATVTMLDAIAEREGSGLEVVLFALPSFATAHPDVAGRHAVQVAPVDGSSKARRVWAENRWLPGAARRAGVDLMHHAGGVLPLADRGPATVTIHDLQPLDLPSNFSIVKQRYLSATLGPSARRARLTAVPSDFTRQRVIERLGVGAERVRVVPWAVPTMQPQDGPGPDPIGQPYALYPAITYPHKNHRLLLDAFAQVDDPDLQLVLIGGAGSAEADVVERLSRTDLSGRVRRLGRVPGETRDALLAGARMVLFPSRYEGFGLPVLEAMAAGVPTVISEIPPLVEVAPPSTPRAGVDDVGGWAAAIALLADDAELRAELSTAGRETAATFTPERTASAMVDVWRDALPRSP